MSRLFIVRHGETEWNALGLLQGAVDVPLAEAGREQAATAATVLSGLLSADATVISSPLSRAHDTALALGDQLGVPVHVDARLRERAYGPWEGVTAEDRERGWPDAVARWRSQGDPGIPGFEGHGAVRARMVASLEEWVAKAPGDVVAFTHGSSGRVGMMGLLGLSLEHRTLGNLGNAAWSRLTRHSDGAWTLDRHAVTAQTAGAL